MSDSSKHTPAVRFRFPYPADIRRAVSLLLAFILPLLPLLLLAVLDQPAEQPVRIALLMVSGLLLAGSAYTLVRFLFGTYFALGNVIHNLELHHTLHDEIEPADNMLQTLVTLGYHFHTWGEHQYRLEILQKQAHLNAFQSQINPHFLYNMLDTIRGQALEDGSAVTSDMIEALSRMMRYAISNMGSMVTLGAEIKSIDNYIKIQQFRFGNRFKYIKVLDEIDNRLIDQKIPKLTLQPIVENAIFHGVESLLSGGEIKLTGFNTQSRLVIQIADNGNGMSEDQLAEVRKKLQNPDTKAGDNEGKGAGIALSNVNARLKLAFGNQYGISVFSTLNVGTMVEITMPAAL